MTKYLHLTKLIDLLTEDNGLDYEAKPREEWKWPANVQTLEEQAARMTLAEKVEFVCGEQGEHNRLVLKRGLRSLDIFMEAVFQGDLYGNFYNEWDDD
jgi:hypothetical protein